MSRRSLARRVRGRISADLIVVVVLFAALIAFSVWTTTHQMETEEAPAYSTHSTAGRGAAALYLWLEELGYRVERIENSPFRLEAEARVLFVLAPAQAYNDIQTRLLQRWVSQPGHTLVLVAEGSRGAALVQEFEAQVEPLPEPSDLVTPTTALLASPPPGPIEARLLWGLVPEGDDHVILLRAGEMPVLTSQRRAAGRVVLATLSAPFTNAGLRDPGSARLVHNLVAGLEPGALILFDEIHHGFAAAGSENTLLAWIYRTPWGWALLYGAAVLLGWMVLRGRRFGRPVPLPERVARRPQSEYVTSMAGLFRRAGRRTFVMRHHHDRLKRELARPWRLNPDLPDGAFVDELVACRDDLETGELRDLLARLAGERVTEAELVRLAGEVNAWLVGNGR